ncbi:hypothetical protein [Flavobacterium sp.]|uniref:hypothetical protein n=1 Tax=Flavobacterium sp. TaxID=239 RepID=UPI003BCF5298
MKILFICGTFSPGKDGVGDYINKMSHALTKKGHEINIIAIRDKYCNELYKEIKSTENNLLTISCISKKVKLKKRFIYTQKIINEFNPDWISLQFVPFGFNKKGIPFWLPNFINKLEGEFCLEIMFHELWIGRKIGIKNKLVSFLQETNIKNLLRKNKPKVIDTHLPVYFSNIEKLGYKPCRLPLFSNISPTKDIILNKKENTFIWAFFSQINITPKIINFINKINIELHEKGIISELIIIGGEKTKNLKYKEIYKKLCPLFKTITITGFLDEKEISTLMQHCDIGITPIPLHALGKSGTTAAFLAHGIPVAVPVISKGYTEENIGFFDSSVINSIITKAKLCNISKAKIAAENNKHKFDIDYVNSIFLQNLK